MIAVRDELISLEKSAFVYKDFSLLKKTAIVHILGKVNGLVKI